MLCWSLHGFERGQKPRQPHRAKHLAGSVVGNLGEVPVLFVTSQRVDVQNCVFKQAVLAKFSEQKQGLVMLKDSG